MSSSITASSRLSIDHALSTDANPVPAQQAACDMSCVELDYSSPDHTPNPPKMQLINNAVRVVYANQEISNAASKLNARCDEMTAIKAIADVCITAAATAGAAPLEAAITLVQQSRVTQSYVQGLSKEEISKVVKPIIVELSTEASKALIQSIQTTDDDISFCA